MVRSSAWSFSIGATGLTIDDHLLVRLEVVFVKQMSSNIFATASRLRRNGKRLVPHVCESGLIVAGRTLGRHPVARQTLDDRILKILFTKFSPKFARSNPRRAHFASFGVETCQLGLVWHEVVEAFDVASLSAVAHHHRVLVKFIQFVYVAAHVERALVLTRDVADFARIWRPAFLHRVNAGQRFHVWLIAISLARDSTVLARTRDLQVVANKLSNKLINNINYRI